MFLMGKFPSGEYSIILYFTFSRVLKSKSKFVFEHGYTWFVSWRRYVGMHAFVFVRSSVQCLFRQTSASVGHPWPRNLLGGLPDGNLHLLRASEDLEEPWLSGIPEEEANKTMPNDGLGSL